MVFEKSLEGDSPHFTHYKFRPRKFFLLGGLLLGILVVVGLLIVYSPFPSSFSYWSKVLASAFVGLLFFGLWMILYRNTRPKDPEYRQRQNLAGLSIFLIMLVLFAILPFLDYLMMKLQIVPNFSLVKYFTGQYLTDNDFTFVQLMTDFERFLSVLPFQMLQTILIVLLFVQWGPQKQQTRSLIGKSNVIVSNVIWVFWLILISILMVFGIGLQWSGTQNRLFFFEGFYPQQFSTILLPWLIGSLGGVLIFFRIRQYFWSNLPTKKKSILAWGLVIGAFLFFNIVFSFNKIYPDYLINTNGIALFFFFFLSSVFSISFIYAQQARYSVMGGSPSRSVIWASRILWILFFLIFIGYIVSFVLLDQTFIFSPTSIILYYPNFTFGVVFTYAFKNLIQFFQEQKKLKKETRRPPNEP